jgi:hypothetical protein
MASATGAATTGKIDDDDKVEVLAAKDVSTYGKYPSQQVAGIFKEWKKAGPKADLHPDHLRFVVGYEFADIQPPNVKEMIDSVTRVPEIRQVANKRYNPDTGKLTDKKEWRKFNPDTGRSYSDKGLKFEQGQYVEFLGNDMQWHLAPVRRVVKLAPDDYDETVDDEPDYDYFYNVGSASLLDTSQVRAPEEGLKLIFGFGPWVWQQWACLQLETFTRFQQDHDQDFVNANFRKVASDLWTYWVENKRNAEFKVLYDGVEAWKPPKNGPGTQEKLMTHIMSPFRIMDDIAKNKGDKYTLVDDVSIFTYVSYLGSGWVTVIITLVIQFTVPILLLITAVESLSGPKRFSNGGFDTNWNDFCRDDGALSGRLMNIMVLLLYMIRVLPNLLYEFYSSSGEDDTGSSKMDEVRRQIFEQGDDTPWMQFGYKLDIYANSVYICMIMTLMLFILFLTDDIFNIILNALALEFVGSLDEELSKGDWFDAGGRFVTAAATELLIRATLRLEWIEDASKFQTEYGIDPAAWARAMYIANGKCNEDEYDEAMRAKEGLLHEKITRSMSKYMNVSLCDYRQGRKDSTNPNLMSKKGRYQHQAAKVARETKNKLAIWNFVEEVHQFGVIDQLAVMVRFMDTACLCVTARTTRGRAGAACCICAPRPRLTNGTRAAFWLATVCLPPRLSRARARIPRAPCRQWFRWAMDWWGKPRASGSFSSRKSICCAAACDRTTS